MVVVVHAFNTNTWEVEVEVHLCEFEPGLQWVPGQQGCYTEKPVSKKAIKNKNQQDDFWKIV